MNWNQYAAYALLVIGVGGFLWSNRSGIFAGLRRLFGGGGIASVVPAGDDDTADFQALARLQHRFERLQCKEGMDACTTALTHFFNGHPGQQ